MLRAISFVLLIGCLSSCSKEDAIIIIADEDVNLGGATSISGSFIQIFQQPSPNLNTEELEFHRASDRAFGDIFVTAPSEVNGGLGPVYNQNACESCHTSNGRSPFPLDPNNLRGLLLRISMPGKGVNGEPLSVPHFGGQLQNKALFNISPEGKISWMEHIETVKYADGEEITLTKPIFSITDTYVNLPSNILISPRIAPPVIGLGLLEAINEADIEALADIVDANNDGISGKPNKVWNYKESALTLGRFGWKAGQPTLLQQTAAAYNQDMGVTSSYFPIESSYGQDQADGQEDDPEIDDITLKAATFYPQSLAVPRRRNVDDAVVNAGKKLFKILNCHGCHNPMFVTGQHEEYNFLSGQTIYPYTDLLLHDMGDGLADGRSEFDADGREWRTPPLWGLGLAKSVGGQNANYLHDGRAKTLEEAILWHGGEAEVSKNTFKTLSKNDRVAVVKFLESL
ncbi:MAG: di-heme oxidoredictase family protein [Saprospiraceae bacterium]